MAVLARNDRLLSVNRNVLFAVESVECAEVEEAELPELQAFLEANPEYYHAVNGTPPSPNEARDEFEFNVPAEWSFGKKWFLLFRRKDGCIVGLAGLISNLFAEGVWHIGIFIVATSLHGSGVAKTLYKAMENWISRRGAKWVRLGVVEGNSRAERFWERMGYVDVRKRRGIEMGKKVNDLRVMAKPLAGGSLTDYSNLVQRDRPESA